MKTASKLPFHVSLFYSLGTITLLAGLTYVGQDIIIPVIMALLFAILLQPIVATLNRKFRIPAVLASIVAVGLFIMAFIVLFYFISIQVTDMIGNIGQIKRNLAIHIDNLQLMIAENFNLNINEQQKIMEEIKQDSIQGGKQLIGSTIIASGGSLIDFILIPVYIFLFLLYKNHLIKFLTKLFRKEHHPKLRDILSMVKVSVQSYIVGLAIEMILVAAMTAIGFMIIGLKYAILLGIITGLLNLIPYIGVIIAGAISVVTSLTGSADLSLIIAVIVVNILVQLVDNNIISPMAVSSKVEINAFFSIIGVIIGGVLGGISGMFLAIPLIAIVKVIFDRIESLEPWGYLLGDELPKTFAWNKVILPLYAQDAVLDILTDEEAQGDQKI